LLLRAQGIEDPALNQGLRPFDDHVRRFSLIAKFSFAKWMGEDGRTGDIDRLNALRNNRSRLFPENLKRSMPEWKGQNRQGWAKSVSGGDG
jgi:hypothetical protein